MKSAHSTSFLLLFLFISAIAFSITLLANAASNAATGSSYLSREHFARLIRYFNSRGWMWDGGGGMAVRVIQPNTGGKELLYASAGIYEKSFYEPEDIYIYDYAETMQISHLENITLPAPISAARDNGDTRGIIGSWINMLRYANYERQKNASFAANDFVAMMHTHSKYSNLLSGMYQPGQAIRLSGEQMQNCIEDRSTGLTFTYKDELLVPISENTLNEGLFFTAVMQILRDFPKSSAVIMHRHGIFVWGQNTWGRTKAMLECYEYLLEIEYNRVTSSSNVPPTIKNISSSTLMPSDSDSPSTITPNPISQEEEDCQREKERNAKNQGNWQRKGIH